jgi:1-aminocyclopropane-1-carboxylate deaminase/D-cysteine desulfhydrase-like pyridoxal-dependent ACC family enzyme
VIVRIMEEGQFRLPDDLLGELTQLDNQVAAAVSAGDEAAFSAGFPQLLAFVRTHGTPVANDDLVTSDHVLPHAETTLADARSTFSGQGALAG